jgi:DNA polymerase
VAICLPFIQRLIELVQPKILITLGGPASKALLGESQGVGRLRGRWFTYKSAALENPIDATVMFSPESLFKTPNQKRASWQDLLMIREKLNV